VDLQEVEPGRFQTGTEPDTCAFVSEMVLAAKVLALTALDVCNRPVAGGAGRPD